MGICMSSKLDNPIENIENNGKYSKCIIIKHI